MHIHEPHFGEVVSVSSTGRSVSTSSHAVHLHPSVPSYIQEDIQTNAAVESWEFGYDLGDTTLIGEVQDPLVDGIVFTTKRKVFENSVRGPVYCLGPLTYWWSAGLSYADVGSIPG
jgi:hypothetical protein